MTNIANNISNLIHTIRGQQVMLDSDLANFYGYEVKRLNEQVKNNINKFPNDFMFQLTKDEMDIFISRSKKTTLNAQGKNINYLPYVFTEQGIYMLSTVLEIKATIAIKDDILTMIRLTSIH